VLFTTVPAEATVPGAVTDGGNEYVPFWIWRIPLTMTGSLKTFEPTAAWFGVQG
jgi:hypothetical protein